MDIKIYQINSDRDKNRICFMGTESLEKFQGSAEINSAIYDKVYEGTVDCANLEEVFELFNLNHPPEFCGHSLSVSDVVQVVESDTAKKGFFFCDSIGFAHVVFHPEQTQERSNTMRVVLLEPGKVARVTDIDKSLRGMQRVVKGDIEAVYPFEEEVCIVCNSEGKINGMPLNRAIRVDSKIADVIAGPCFICDCSGEDFASLSDDQLKRYQEKFKLPERFSKQNGEIIATPYEPKNKTQER